MKENNFNIRHIFNKIIIWSLSVSGIVGIIIVLFGVYDSFILGRVFLTGLLIGGYSLMGLVLGKHYDENQSYKTISFVGSGLIAIPILIYTFTIWEIHIFNNSLFIKFMFLANSYIVLSALIGGVASKEKDNNENAAILQKVVVSSIEILFILETIIVLFFDYNFSYFGTIISVLGLIIIFGIAVLAFLRRSYKNILETPRIQKEEVEFNSDPNSRVFEKYLSRKSIPNGELVKKEITYANGKTAIETSTIIYNEESKTT